MLGSIGMPELIIIFVIALIVFGPRRLPELGRTLGQSIAEFKRATTALQTSLDDEIRAEERKASLPSPAPAETVAHAAETVTHPAEQAQTKAS